MAPRRLQNLRIVFLYTVEKLTIGIFFYGASSSFMVYGSYTSTTKGIFVVLFSASVAIFVFVFSFPYFLARADDPIFHRRRGFSNRAIAAMFVVTVINFLLIGLAHGTMVATFIVSFRKALTPDIEYPPSKKGELVNEVLQNLMIIDFWSANLPVSSNLLLLCCYSIPYLFTLGGGIIQRSHCHLEGLGSLPRSTIGNPHTIYVMDWSRG